jgi:hypothetical protein
VAQGGSTVTQSWGDSGGRAWRSWRGRRHQLPPQSFHSPSSALFDLVFRRPLCSALLCPALLFSATAALSASTTALLSTDAVQQPAIRTMGVSRRTSSTCPALPLGQAPTSSPSLLTCVIACQQTRRSTGSRTGRLPTHRPSPRRSRRIC